jgi:hypothetical protein
MLPSAVGTSAARTTNSASANRMPSVPCACGCNIPKVLADDDAVSTRLLEGRSSREGRGQTRNASRMATQMPSAQEGVGLASAISTGVDEGAQREESAWGADVHVCCAGQRHSLLAGCSPT